MGIGHGHGHGHASSYFSDVKRPLLQLTTITMQFVELSLRCTLYNNNTKAVTTIYLQPSEIYIEYCIV